MRHVRSWNDLAPYGIIPLTGEACGLMFRILFDLTERGRRIVGRCFGIPKMTLGEQWNGGSEDDPHVGSIMLSQDMLVPIAIFAMLDTGCTEVWLFDGYVMGIEKDNPIESLREIYTPLRVLRAAGTAGDRNVHCMSGRVE